MTAAGVMQIQEHPEKQVLRLPEAVVESTHSVILVTGAPQR
jgi:hypothetical protein